VSLTLIALRGSCTVADGASAVWPVLKDGRAFPLLTPRACIGESW
jgi:hypothetical protein